DYLNYLASLDIQYQNKHGAVPESFDQAHSESGVVLPNRGDKYGRGLAYVDFQPDAFMFRSYGVNNHNVLGLGVELGIYYIAGKIHIIVIFMEAGFRKNKTTEPNQAPEPTTLSVTPCAPSRTGRARQGRGSS